MAAPRLSLVTGPAVEPVSLELVKADRDIRHAEHDALLGMLISSAREQAEQITGRAFISQVWQQRHVVPLQGVLALLRWPVLAVESVLVDGLPLDLAELEFIQGDDASVAHPSFLDAELVVVTYRAGYGDAPESVPAPLRNWLLVQVGTLYEHREAVVVGTIVSPLPHVAGLLSPYKVRRFV